MQLLYVIMLTLPPPQGGGHNRHIFIITKPTIYHPHNHGVDQPARPGINSTIPINATAALQDQLQLKHGKWHRIYENTETMDEEALKNHVTNAFEDTYIKKLKKKYTGFPGVTCLNILNNLIDH